MATKSCTVMYILFFYRRNLNLYSYKFILHPPSENIISKVMSHYRAVYLKKGYGGMLGMYDRKSVGMSRTDWAGMLERGVETGNVRKRQGGKPERGRAGNQKETGRPRKKC